ncbi:MFS general substrate transporter [Lindgomyces ingoldianus]|uniref:MFS general substrate transporter n=1 Tax=Lindgomyces ingoldianus TaxID=673940 RepID=A0ACB6QUA1_9PLEO|nr:MFS general substrate transporter [Lindgomyces ingoldianus]KAF2470599.1 MFS general substrate transporter [Lindgomyces ingoldianus]
MFQSSISAPPALNLVKEEKDIIKIDENDKHKALVNKPQEQDEMGYPSGSKPIFIVLALVFASSLASLDMTIVVTAIPKVTDEFRSLANFPWGKAYKYFPLKTTLRASIFVFELGSPICGVALNPNSSSVTGAYTIIAFAAEPKEQPMFTGFDGMSYGIAAVLGPLIGGVFADKVCWCWCFYINLSVSQPKAWNSSQVIGLLAGFMSILISFCIWEAFQGECAMIVPRVCKHRLINTSCVDTCFFSESYFLVIYYLPIYFQSVSSASPTISGVYSLPLTITVTLPIIVRQGSADANDVSFVTAMILFAQSAFVNKLLSTLPMTTPDVDPTAVVVTCATQILVYMVVYMVGLKVALAIAVAITGIAFFVSLFGRWKRLSIEAVEATSGCAWERRISK